MAISIDEAHSRMREGIEVSQGKQGTLLLKIDGFSIGIVQPITGTKAAFNRAVKAAKLDLIAETKKNNFKTQGVIYLAHDNEPGYAEGVRQPCTTAKEGNFLGHWGLTYEIETRNDSRRGDQLNSALRFIERLEKQSQEGREHMERVRQRMNNESLSPAAEEFAYRLLGLPAPKHEP